MLDLKTFAHRVSLSVPVTHAKLAQPYSNSTERKDRKFTQPHI